MVVYLSHKRIEYTSCWNDHKWAARFRRGTNSGQCSNEKHRCNAQFIV